MVTTVYGKIENIDVVFSSEDGCIWKTDIPKLPSGTHILELYATDEAGNTAYFATALVYVNPDNMVSKILFVDYAEKAYKSHSEDISYKRYIITPYSKEVD